jgi:hypothetical protein
LLAYIICNLAVYCNALLSQNLPDRSAGSIRSDTEKTIKAVAFGDRHLLTIFPDIRDGFIGTQRTYDQADQTDAAENDGWEGTARLTRLNRNPGTASG